MMSGYFRCPSCGYFAFDGVECFDCGYRSPKRRARALLVVLAALSIALPGCSVLGVGGPSLSTRRAEYLAANPDMW